MNIDDRPTDLRAHSHILQKFQMAITLQRVNRSPSRLVLGWDFGGRRIERGHFRLEIFVKPPKINPWRRQRCRWWCVQGYRQTNAYIVTQWPLTETVNDIWRMAYEYNISTIVLLNEEPPSNVSEPFFSSAKFPGKYTFRSGADFLSVLTLFVSLFSYWI